MNMERLVISGRKVGTGSADASSECQGTSGSYCDVVVAAADDVAVWSGVSGGATTMGFDEGGPC
jgi:hypothetical protein